MAKKNLSLQAKILEELKSPEFAAHYLNEHLSYRGKLNKELLFEAISNVIEAHGVSSISKSAKLHRRTLYSAFSQTGNPSFQTLIVVMDALGVKIKFEAKKPA